MRDYCIQLPNSIIRPRCIKCNGVPTVIAVDIFLGDTKADEWHFCTLHWKDVLEQGLDSARLTVQDDAARSRLKASVLENANPDNYPSLVEWATDANELNV